MSPERRLRKSRFLVTKLPKVAGGGAQNQGNEEELTVGRTENGNLLLGQILLHSTRKEDLDGPMSQLFFTFPSFWARRNRM